jgi:protease-4
LDKLGVNVQLIRHGKYKSAGEMFIRNSASPENLEQNQVLVNSMWKTISTDIAQGRGIETEQLDKAISELKLQFPADFLALNLVDSLTTREQLKQRLAVLSGKESFSEVSLIPFGDYVQAKTGKDNGYRKIAIIYADGEIVEGKDPTNVAGNRFASLIAKVRNDASVEAVVFRVNSPGGSVTASDKIKNEIDLLRAEKPVIASYANYAASGGYWISNSCDKIFSNATTLTGSIGVFGMIPDLSKTMKNIVHVNITPVTTHKHGDMYSLMRPFDKEETAYMQASIEDIYDTFVHTVAEGRDLVPEFVDSVAQGRVWSGSDALGIGLVDELGTLTDALKFAAVKVTGDSDLSSWTIAEYPEPRTTLEMVMEALGEMTPDEEMIFAGTPLEKTAKHVMNWADSWKKSQYGEWAFARMPYEMVIR